MNGVEAQVFTLSELEAIGAPRAIGAGEYVTIDQARIDAFAAATDDHQWIHVDPERAAATRFGGTIAHGFLTLSLLPVLVHRVVSVSGVRMAVNCGLRAARFPAVVPAGGSVRARVRFLEARRVPRDGSLEVTWEVSVECRGQLLPSCVAQWVVRYYGPDGTTAPAQA